MKVTARNWQMAQSSYYRLASQDQVKDQEQLKDQQPGVQEEQKELPTATETRPGITGIQKQDKDQSSDLDLLVKSFDAQSAAGSPTSGKVKPSSNSTSGSGIGELAAQLAQAQTKLDVQQIAGKAMRALVNLQMAAAMSEGTDKKKAQQNVARMKKLIKRINKKMQHLAKEEQMELKIKKAEKKQELKKAEELQKELKKNRTKRRRDERNYASKELSKDRQEATNEMVNSLGGGGSASSAPVDPAAAAASGVPAMSGDMMSLEPVSIDISV